MITIKSKEELKGYLGKEIGATEWQTITQEQINDFAKATGDHQWIHIDVEKAKQFSPFRTTIAHGFLTLSLAPMLIDQIFKMEGVKMGVNYGLNKVRFINPVPAGAKVRMRATLANLEDVDNNGVQVTMTLTYELDGADKPACVAESLMRFYL
ncbi:MAG: MaoC family dehydratase [Cytophagales bacterium]|nr:MAG: MaoC family dehydratase [Cytophagales bacterium]